MPNGIRITHPKDESKYVEIYGPNVVTPEEGRAGLLMTLDGFKVTRVDAEIIDAFLAACKNDFPPINKGLLSFHATEESAKSEGKEKKTMKTGFERGSTEDVGLNVKTKPKD